MNERDQEILKLAKKAVSSMAYAKQNAELGHEKSVWKHEQESEDAMQQLESLLQEKPNHG